MASYVTSSGAQGGHWSGDYTISLGVTATAGEIIVAVVRTNVGDDGGEPNGAGWALWGEDPDVDSFGGSQYQVYWIEAVGGETSVQIDTLSVGAESSNSTIFLVDADQIDGVPDFHHSTSATVVAPEGTASENASVVVWVFGGGGNLTSGPDIGTHVYDGADFEHVALGVNAGGSGACTITKSFTHTQSITLVLGPTPAAGNDLTGQDLSSGTPTLENGTVGQTFVLTGQDLSSGTPTLEAGTVGQTFVLTGQDLSSGAPTLENGTIGQTFELTGQDLSSSAPTLETGTVGQTFTLTGQDLLSGTPTLEPGVVGQTFVLTGQNLSSGTPILENGTVAQPGANELVGQDLTSAAPTLETGTVGQIFTLTGQDLLSGAPTVENGTLTQPGANALTGQDLDSGTPTLEGGTIGQTFNLTGQDLSSSAPILEAGTVGQVAGITGQDLIGAAPTLENGTVNQVQFDLTGQDLFAGAPTLTIGSLGGGNEIILTADQVKGVKLIAAQESYLVLS